MAQMPLSLYFHLFPPKMSSFNKKRRFSHHSNLSSILSKISLKSVGEDRRQFLPNITVGMASSTFVPEEVPFGGPLPRFTFTGASGEPTTSNRSWEEPMPMPDESTNQRPQKIIKPIIIQPSRIPSPSSPSASSSASIMHQKAVNILSSSPQRLSRRQFSDNNLRPSVTFSPNGLTISAAEMDSSSQRRHSGHGQSRVPFVPIISEKREQQQQRLPLRAFKKIGRVGTLPALAHSQNPGGLQQAMAAQSPGLDDLPLGSAMSSSSRATGSAFQRWTGLPGHRRGSHLGWDSARPQSAARLQQQMLEKIYTKNELKEYQQLFKMFDTDGSGAIGSEELKGAMQSIGLEADDAEIERLIKEVDEDGNGEIDFPEFCQCMKTAERQGGFRQRPTNDEVVRQCFEVFDQDCNGLISENEFIYVAKDLAVSAKNWPNSFSVNYSAIRLQIIWTWIDFRQLLRITFPIIIIQGMAKIWMRMERTNTQIE